MKARTEPFKTHKNAQNHFNDRLKAANKQLKGEGGGTVTLDLGEHTTIAGQQITTEVARDMVKNGLAKGGRGSNITNVVVKDGNGNMIYSGLGD